MALKILKTLLFAAAALLLLAGVLYFFNGSLELFPTEEQQEAERIAAGLLIVCGAVAGAVGLLIGPKKTK